MIIECFGCHLDGRDNIPATKKLTFKGTKGIGSFDLDLCDKCYKSKKISVRLCGEGK